MSTQISMHRSVMTIIAVLQGTGLFVLHQATEQGVWPGEDYASLMALYTFILVWPLMLLLGLGQGDKRQFVWLSLTYSLIASAIGFYSGLQIYQASNTLSLLSFAYFVSMAIATFKVQMYIQQYSLHQPVTYNALFLWSWRNFLTLSLALLFTLIGIGLFALWAALFEAIGITLFSELFEKPWFYYPATTLGAGLGITLFLSLTHIIDTITRLLQALIKLLLFLVSLISILFIATLLMKGLGPLWESGGSTLLFWMQAISLLFLNIYYQNAPEGEKTKNTLFIITVVGCIILPIYSLISLYGLYLRIDQYGWSVSRYWAIIVWGMLAYFSFGYLWTIVRYQRRWLAARESINVWGGILLIVVLLAINSPILNLYKMAADDFMSRISEQDIDPTYDDLKYLHSLKRPGYNALQEIGIRFPHLKNQIDYLYHSKEALTREHFALQIKTSSPDIPQNLIDKIYQRFSTNHWLRSSVQEYHLFPVDANMDGLTEYIVMYENHTYVNLELYSLKEGEWEKHTVSHLLPVTDNKLVPSEVTADDIALAEPEWKDIQVNGIRFKID